jgi:hypothetical protein
MTLSPTEERLMHCNSYERTRVLAFEMLEEPSPAKRVLLFHDYFNCCDAPWPYCGYLARFLREALQHVRLADVLPSPEREWLASLGPLVQVHRGCERGLERGLSWTTSVRVATGFAIGKRCRNPNPTLMTAVIPKEHIFGLSLARNENEVVVDPRRLRRLMNHPDSALLLATKLREREGELQ